MSEWKMAYVTELPGYELEALRVGSEFALYRGRQHGDTAPILVLAPLRAQQTPADLRRLEHEYALADNLDPAWAVRPLAIARRDGRSMIVLEDVGGELLEGMLGRPLPLARFLPIAVALAAALRQVHQHGLVHKDIRPANVFVDAAGNVRLTGFGMASRLPRERQAPAPPEMIAGTLAYMAPEQTGRMNRSIDARSDLYALGVTLYEMIAGALPFSASDPMEWIHCHIARPPPPPSERAAGIPGPVEAIILKLLAKSAEDRYQTAAGLEADLRACLAEWESHCRIDPFPLGARDVSDRLLIPEKLYGREREIEILLAAFDQVVAHGATELVLVSGYSGIGKSSVVNELQKALVPPRGLFASGKFDQFKRDIPYATLAQAFQGLVRPLLGQSETELGRWREALVDALGPNGRLMVNLVPELELVIGTQPPLPDLPPKDAQNRFQMVFRRFLGVFARPEHPLALFLDDLQWLDAATLELLERLVADRDVRHLLLVGAYRDNEVGPAHPLMRTLEAIRNAGASVQEIVLTPLGIEDVEQLVADALHCDPQRAQPLAQLVQEKTGGNPFFAIQFFTALTEEGLIAFDQVARAWQWNMDRIRAKSYTDNVVDLMAGKLNRLPDETQEALKQLACLGNTAEIATLTMVLGEPEQAIHGALWEAVRAGFIIRLESAYKFLHDRIQQAAYSLIPEEQRADIHLRIGRVLLAYMTADQLAEHLFDVANQLNRGAGRLIDRDEKAQVAAIDLRAGRKAKASAAYTSARLYFAAGMALLDERDWANHYELAFSLSLERAECEYLSGSFDEAAEVISELLARGASKIDKAAAYCLKIDLHVMKSENPKGVESALECLRLFDIEMSAHPTSQQVDAEYEKVWNSLGERPIESLIDLPLMTDPEMQAAMRVLSVLFAPAYFTDINLVRLHLCHMVNVSMKYGTTDASAQAYSWFGTTLGSTYRRYIDGYRFGKVACELVEKHEFLACKAKTYFPMEMVVLWTQPIETALDYIRAAFRAGVEAGDLAIACFSSNHAITDLLTRGDPLDEVWRESERGLDFVRKARFRDVVDIIVSQQRFIENMRGRTAGFSTFSDAHFDQTAFEAQLTEDRMATMVCWYWILKIQARFMSSDYEAAIAAAWKAKALLWSSDAHIQLLDYHYYSALAIAAAYEAAPLDRQREWRGLLTAHREQLREWADNYPPTFADKHALVSAEIARLEVRDVDAMRLYEQAVQSARENGFVQNEGLANELAARFYAARGFETIAHAYLRNAWSCYLRWGAEGKVRQLEQLHPHLREDPVLAAGATAIGAPVEQLDVGAVIKASQAVSGEIVLDRLIETLMTIAIEHAGAECGLLILLRGDAPWIEAEARTDEKTVEVTVRQEAVTPADLPESLLHTVIRMRQSVILDDASTQNPFSGDPYIREKRARSVLCLPLVKQAELIGVLYLENNLASHVFTPARISLLELLASQAAISLENARLYGELTMSEERWRNLFESVPVGIALIGSHRRYVAANPAFQTMTGYSEAELCSLSPVDITHEDDQSASEAIIAADAAGEPFDQHIEKRYRRKDGGITLAEVSAFQAPVAGRAPLLAAFAVDVTERKRAEEALRDAQTELARAARLTTLGELTASIAHEINQPLAAIASNGVAGLNWLNREEPDLGEARDAFSRVVRDVTHAGDVIRGLRALARKSGPQLTRLDIDDVIEEVLVLTRGEMRRQGVALHTDLAAGERPVLGDRVQLQQVLLNLIMNGVEAMKGVSERRRELTVSSTLAEPGSVLVAVEDTGAGLDPAAAQRLFEPFFTTKPEGLGIGLAICRSIIEVHGGRLWASPRAPHGAVFRFTVPAAPTIRKRTRHSHLPMHAGIIVRQT
jgi:PAS domain S-box-containing protein